MRRTNNGITLIALIITIVVLLILAVVAIRAVTGDRILEYATNARDDYQDAAEEENTTLQSYLDKIEENVPGGNGGSNETKVAVKGEKVTGSNAIYTETVDGKTQTAIIPVGFCVVKDIEGDENSISRGLVISDVAEDDLANSKSGNQFVWIPVEDLNSFARLQDGSETNYRGVLYNWSSDATGKTEYTWSSTSTSYREPANITSSSYADTASRFSTITWTNTYYQESFNKMIESVSKYKGFYVGRYETSLNGTVAQSKSGETPMNNVNWWNMYENSLTYSTNNSSLGVESEMIWGCQWDAMLKFILTTEDASHVTSTSNAPHDYYDDDDNETGYFKNAPYRTGGTNYSEDYTGSVVYNDKAANIYDLEGNVREWTQEANITSSRVGRGGYFSGSYSPSRRGNFFPTGPYSGSGSRLSLYVK